MVPLKNCVNILKNSCQSFSNFAKREKGLGDNPNSALKAKIALIEKDTTRRENHRPLFLMNVGAKLHS